MIPISNRPTKSTAGEKEVSPYEFYVNSYTFEAVQWNKKGVQSKGIFFSSLARITLEEGDGSLKAARQVGSGPRTWPQGGGAPRCPG